MASIFIKSLITLLFVVTAFAQVDFKLTLEVQDRERFFLSEKTISLDFLKKYRAEVFRRKQEIINVYVNIDVNKGKDVLTSVKSASGEDEVVALDLILKYIDELSKMPSIMSAEQRNRSQIIAQRIIDLNFATQTIGLEPAVLSMPSWAAGMAQPWTLNLNTPIEQEAINLWDYSNKKYYSIDDLKNLKAQGVDLSTLNPAPNSSVWRNPGKISSLDIKENYFEGKTALYQGIKLVFPAEKVGFYKKVRATQTTPKVNIEYLGDDGLVYKGKLKIGKEMHSAPTASALFSALGYSADIIRYYRDFKVYFKNKEEITELKKDWMTYFKGKPPILTATDVEDYIKTTGQDAKGSFIIFKECVLTLQPKDLVRVGALDFDRNGVNKWRDARAYALLNLWIENSDWNADNSKIILRDTKNGDYDFHYLVHDVGVSFGGILFEKLDRFRYDPIDSVSESQIKFDFRSSRNQPMRDEITLSDFKWLTRMMAQLTRQQFIDAVELGNWPNSMSQILVEKLISRRNAFVKAFGLLGEKQEDGSIITDLPVNLKLTTEDKAVVNGEVKNGKFEDFQSNFDDYWKSLVWEPSLKAIKDMGKMAARKGLCQMEKIGVEPIFVGWSRMVIAEVLLSACRDVIKNPKPSSDHDIWLVRDTFRFGIRGGGGVVGAADLTLAKKYVLVYGARTEPEGLNARNRFLDVMLPFVIRKGQLPDKYVLIREDFAMPRVRVRSDEAMYTGIGIEAHEGHIFLGRTVVSNRGDGRIAFYKDKVNYNEVAQKLFFDLAIARVPFFKSTAVLGGSSDGTAWVLDSNSVQDSERATSILTDVVTHGDFSQIGTIPGIKKTELDGKIISSTSWALNILGFIKSDKLERKEEVTVVPMEKIGGFKVFRDEYIRNKGYNVLGVSEFDNIRIRGFMTQKEGSSELEPLVMMRFILDDTNTRSDELDNGFIKFLNGFFPMNQLNFTAKLHSSNDRWGSTRVNLDVNYYKEAIGALINMNEKQFVNHFISLQDYDQRKLHQAWNEWYDPDNQKNRNMYSDGTIQLTNLPSHLEKSLDRLADFIISIRKARAETNEMQMSHVVRAIRAAIYNDKKGKSLDPTLFGAINTWIGETGGMYISREIVTPHDVENRFPGGKGLQWNKIGEERSPDVINMIVIPEDVLEVWMLFDWLK